MEPGKMEKAGASRKKGNVFRLGTFLLSLKFSYERGGFVPVSYTHLTLPTIA